MSSDGFLTRGIEYVKEYLQDSLEEKRWTSTRIVTLLSLANRLVFEDLLKSTDPRWMNNFASTTVAITAGQSDYSFPGNFRKFLRLVARDSSVGRISSEILPADPMADLTGLIFLGRNRGFRIYPTPTSTDATSWTLEYEAGVVPMLLEAPGLVYDSAAKTLTLGTVTYGEKKLVDDWYNNSYIRICNHTSGLGVGEVRRITDYVASTGVFTLDSAFTNALDATPSEWTFEILPCLENPLDHAIMLRAVMTIHASGGNYKGRGLISEEYRDVLKAALSAQIDPNARTGPAMSSDFMDRALSETYV